MYRSRFIKIIALLCFWQNSSGYCMQRSFDVEKTRDNVKKYYTKQVPEIKGKSRESGFDVLNNNSTDISSDGNKCKNANNILDNKNNIYIKKIPQNSRLKNFPLFNKRETTGSVYYPRNSGNNNGFKETIYHNVDYLKKAMEHIANAYKCSRRIAGNLMAKNIKKQNIRDFKSNLSRSVLMSSILQCFFNDTKMFFYLRNDVFNISLFTDNDLRNAIKISIPAYIFSKREATLLGTNFRYEGKGKHDYRNLNGYKINDADYKNSRKPGIGNCGSEYIVLLNKFFKCNISDCKVSLLKFQSSIEKFINQNINNKYINNYANQGMKNKLIRAIVIKTIIEHLFDSCTVVSLTERGYTQFILTTGLNHMDNIYAEIPDRAFPSSSLYQCCVPSWKM